MSKLTDAERLEILHHLLGKYGLGGCVIVTWRGNTLQCSAVGRKGWDEEFATTLSGDVQKLMDEKGYTDEPAHTNPMRVMRNH